MHTESSEHRHLLAAHDDVDGVDLDQADSVEDLSPMSSVSVGRPPIRKALCRQSHSSCFGAGQFHGAHRTVGSAERGCLDVDRFAKVADREFDYAGGRKFEADSVGSTTTVEGDRHRQASGAVAADIHVPLVVRRDQRHVDQRGDRGVAAFVLGFLAGQGVLASVGKQTNNSFEPQIDPAGQAGHEFAGISSHRDPSVCGDFAREEGRRVRSLGEQLVSDRDEFKLISRIAVRPA